MPKLTRREHECMRLAASHKTNKAIANALGLSVKTVDGYIDGAKAKLGQNYRSDAITKYLELFDDKCPGGFSPVEAPRPQPVTVPQQPAVGVPTGRGMERLSKLQRLGIIVLISLALTASLALAATWAVRSIAIYDAANPPRTGESR
nr:helix-turn-helix transcriptional regulator [uncultured Sphingomonas sp.]